MPMDYKQKLGILSLLIAVLGYIPYIANVLKGKTKPHAYTWLTWEVIAVVGLGIQLQGKGGAGTWLLGLTTIVTLLIFLLSLKYGHRDIHKIDTLSLTFAGIAFVFWLFADQPLIAAILISLIEAVGGFFPTFRKSNKLPYEETLTSYVAYSISTILALIALDNHSVELMLYPIAVIILNISFVIYVLTRRSKMQVIKK